MKLHQLNPLVAGFVALLLAVGCATKPKVSPEMSEHMRQLAEMRDTCTQYAAWVGRDFDAKSEEFKRSQQLYIEASAAANSYIESLQFDVMTGVPHSEEKYAELSQRVQESSQAFLKDARKSLGIGQTRGFPLFIIPLAEGLASLGSKVSKMSSDRKKENVQLIVNSLGEKKWKPFNELVR